MSFSELYIFYSVLGFMCVQFFWELYLCLRQHRVYVKNTQIPTELIGILPQSAFDKARLYAIDKSKYNMVSDAFSFILSLLFLHCGYLASTWNFGGDILKYFDYERGEIMQSAVFVGILNTLNTISVLPFSIYYNFVLEEKHGFNNQTVSFFIIDKIKIYILQQSTMVPLMCGIIYIVKIGGKYFFIYIWVFVVLMSLFLYTIYPEYIAPWFDKYTPLPEGDLKKEIEKLAKHVGFPLYKIYVVEGSRRSAHSNAYFYGLFQNKRIVIFDTLLKDYTPENSKNKIEDDKDKEKEKEEREKKGCETFEVLAVLGHELGHWKLNHVTKNMALMQGNLFLVFLVFGILFQYKSLYHAFGFYNTMPVVIGLIIVLHFVCLPYFEILTFCMAILSRRFEFQADNFAKSLGRAHYLKCALIKLNIDNLGFPIYDPWFSKWHHSHPPLLERLQALDKDE